MSERNARLGVFILAKNESANIERSLSALAGSHWDVHVLDSGSTDGTQAMAAAFDGVNVIPYTYTDHCTAYNEISVELGCEYDVVVILDADMIVTEQLRAEVNTRLSDSDNAWDALQAPIEMWIEGVRLKTGSLCPPKVFALRTGASRFENTGHAEKLKDGLRVRQTMSTLVHDDRKHYGSYLLSQGRYASNLADRYERDEVSGRDRLRVRTPTLIGIVPAVSYILKGGFLSGRAGALYALDRLIAEAIMYRQSLARRMNAAKKN